MNAPTLSEIHVGMKVEVVNCGNDTPRDNETAYWVATILKVNVNMMLLRYEGYEEDGVDDFWFDVRSKNIHPVGWCYSVQKLLIPPPGNVSCGFLASHCTPLGDIACVRYLAS